MIKTEDLKIEIIGRPRPGGQQVGVSRVGVIITHMPTGLLAYCETERSQFRNKEIALKELTSLVEARLLGVGR